jgi:hypothetical protein
MTWLYNETFLSFQSQHIFSTKTDNIKNPPRTRPQCKKSLLFFVIILYVCCLAYYVNLVYHELFFSLFVASRIHSCINLPM